MKQPIFTNDPDSGMTHCALVDKDGNVFCGQATCHKDDMDMYSETTGNTIALSRATIKYYKYKKKQAETELKILERLKDVIRSGKHFDARHFEYRRLISLLDEKWDDLQYFKFKIKDIEDTLKEYIDGKEDFYQKVRKLHNKK